MRGASNEAGAKCVGVGERRLETIEGLWSDLKLPVEDGETATRPMLQPRREVTDRAPWAVPNRRLVSPRAVIVASIYLPFYPLIPLT